MDKQEKHTEMEECWERTEGRIEGRQSREWRQDSRGLHTHQGLGYRHTAKGYTRGYGPYANKGLIKLCINGSNCLHTTDQLLEEEPKVTSHLQPSHLMPVHFEVRKILEYMCNMCANSVMTAINQIFMLLSGRGIRKHEVLLT